jgi:DNA-binding transcriptional LysR family regulator
VIEHLKALAVFAKTVEHRSFRGAARALALSPSVVSHHVSELERRLSLALLYRSTRRIALTPDGERLYEAAREMLAAAERGLDVVGGRSTSPAGLLRLTAPALLADTPFCRDLAAFSTAYPKVKLRVAFTETRHDLLRDGFDLALRIGRLDDSALKSKKLAVMRRSLVASPRYLAGRAEPRTARDLEGWDFLQLSARKPELTLHPPGKKAPVTIAFEPRIAVDSVTALRELAAAGLGVASVPELVARKDLARGRLVEVLPGFRLPDVPAYAVWPDNAQRPELTLRFIDFLSPRLEALFG